MTERKYLPTYADLIDRLSITLMKSIFIPENRETYLREISDIKHDIGKDADFIYAALVLMLTNRVIWENEALARQGSDQQNDRLRFTHSINGVRNTAKNIIAKHFGERTDLKIDCLAAGLPKEFGSWDVFE